MKPLMRPAIAVRLKRWGLVLAGLSLVVGCSHRRTAMRPVFVGPSAIVAPAASPCPTSEATPAFSDTGELTPSPPTRPIGPARPKTDDVVPQSGGDEPKLLYPNDKPAASKGEAPPPMTGPNATRSSNRRPALGTGRRGDSARQRVSLFVEQPNDLFLPPKADRAWRYIVLHHGDHASGSYAQIDRDHRDRLGTQGCGYHFVIGNGTESPDGRVEVASRWLNQKAGAHCRDSTIADANDYGIGICLIGDLDEKAPTAKQVEATQALVAYLRDRYEVPADRVVTHAAIAQSATSCPGKLFPVDSIVNGRDFASR